ncbi:MAG: hypothetical protein ACPGJS_10230 [Flammeovirgaceae bacterium]
MNACKLLMIITFSLCVVSVSAQEKIKGKGISMDLPKVAPSVINKDSTNLKKNPDPLSKTIINNHNKDIKAFISGKLYVMTGLVGAKTDSLIFEEFAFKQQFDLDATQLREIGKRLSDSNNFPKSDYKMLCAFAPNIGLELTTLKGKKEKYLLAYDCSEIAQANKKGKVEYRYFDMSQMTWFAQLEHTLVLGNKKGNIKLKTCKPNFLIDGEGRIYGGATLGGAYRCSDNK